MVEKRCKVFLAGPFKSLIDPATLSLQDQHKQRFTELIAFFEERGCSVHNAHHREAWGKEFMTPEQCTRIDFDEISQCDYF